MSAPELTSAHTEHPEHSEAKAHVGHPTEGTYLSVFVVLALLTAAELGATYLGGIKAPILLGLAAGKATLVVQFYMHLRYDVKILRYVFLIPVITGVLAVVLLQLFMK